METHPRFLGWKTEYEDVSTALSNLQIQHNPHQSPKDAFCIDRKTHSKIHMDSQWPWKGQNNLEKRRTRPEDSHSLISKLTTKLQQSESAAQAHRQTGSPESPEVSSHM